MYRMRIAIANWGDRVSPVLDTAASLTLIEQDVAGETDRTVIRLDHGSIVGRAQQIAALSLDVLICGAVSRPLFEMISAAGVGVLPFVAGEVTTVLAAFRRGELPNLDLTLPGCCCRWRGRGYEGTESGGAGGCWGASMQAKAQGTPGAALPPGPVQGKHRRNGDGCRQCTRGNHGHGSR